MNTTKQQKKFLPQRYTPSGIIAGLLLLVTIVCFIIGIAYIDNKNISGACNLLASISVLFFFPIAMINKGA